MGDGKERIRKKERGGREKGKGGESVPLALILQFDHWAYSSCIPKSGTTNYRIGPHRTTSDLWAQKMRVNWGSRQA